jgi:plastocyanin
VSVSPRLALALAGALLAVASLALAALALPAAEAANRRVSIADYRWSSAEVRIDRDEHVTWHWVGPDTMHSITGVSTNASGLDSDPDVYEPRHRVGDSFRIDFDQPGTYAFQCKLHSLVRGTVVVSSSPGDPETEADPIPPNRVDLRAPHLSDVRLRQRRAGRGTRLRFGIDEPAEVEAEFYRRPARGARRLPRHRRFAGWQRWVAHVGFNDVSFARRSRRFRARPGRYVAVLRATDEGNNQRGSKRVRFRIRG